MLEWRVDAMTDVERLAVTCPHWPICKLRYHSGAAVWAAARLCF
jgi:hypothetical protein